MKEKKDYTRDIAAIRSMMERSSNFLSLSGRAGIMAGIYALAGAYIAYAVFHFNPDRVLAYADASTGSIHAISSEVILLAVSVFVLALVTAVYLSNKNATERGEKLWNSTSRQLLADVTVPFLTSVAAILILISHNLIGLLAPFCLLFYGLALHSAGKFTFKEIRILGLVQIVLGLFSAYFVEYGLVCWALGFGVAHIIYGIYMHYKYER